MNETRKETIKADQKMAKDTSSKEIEVKVQYVAAEKAFKEVLDRNVTVEQLKNQVLSVFGLTEGQMNDGNTVTYTLYNHKTPLENSAQTLGDVAGDKKELHLKLCQQITQGHAE